jgi:hypothetical protein
MRKKLLNAQDGTVRWQARLGELLHGNPKPWDEAFQKEGSKSADFWIALEAVDRPAPALIPTYKLMSQSDDPTTRLRAVNALARYMLEARSSEADGIVLALLDYEVPEVRSAAWYAAGKLGIGDPDKVIASKSEPPEVRLAAAYCALMQAQGGPPETRWARELLPRELGENNPVPANSKQSAPEGSK